MVTKKSSAIGSATNDAVVTKSAAPLLKQMRTLQQRARKRPPGRPTAEQSNALREVLIHAAMRSFMERGFDGSSIEAIGREAKVAKITIYRQFGDKAELFRAVTHYGLASLRARLSGISEFSDKPEIGLRKLIEKLYEANTHPDFLAVQRMVITEAIRFPEFALAMLDNSNFGLEPAIDYLDRLRAEGHIVVSSPRVAVLQLMALSVGGTRFLMRDPATDPMDKKRWLESVYTIFARAWGLEPVPRPIANKMAVKPSQ